MSDWYSLPNKRSAGYRPGEREAIAAYIAAHGVKRLERPADITTDVIPLRPEIVSKARAKWAVLVEQFRAAPTMETVEALAEKRGCSVKVLLKVLKKAGIDPYEALREQKARRAAA